MNSPLQKNFAEFFAGIGLMRVGLERAGWSIAFANDIDGDKWEMYRTHFADPGESIVGDVHQLDAANGRQPVVAAIFHLAFLDMEHHGSG